MDYSGFRPSQNIDRPGAIPDWFMTMLRNPLRSQWETRDEDGFRIPRTTIGNTAAEFPTMPPADPRFMQSQLAQSLGVNQIAPPPAQAPYFPPQIPGLQTPGNIDLNARPVVHNPDGSISTVRSMSFNHDGREVLIPTVSDDGRIMSQDEAIQNFHTTGKHLGMFDTPDNATAYAQSLHEQQANQYLGR